MDELEFQRYHEASFDAFCKKVIKTITADYYRIERRRKKMTQSVEMIDPLSHVSLLTENQYGLYCRTFYVGSTTIDIHNEDIGEVMQYIVPNRRSVLLLSYFMNLKDADIARMLHISSPTVARRKKHALDDLRRLIGGKNRAQ